MAKLDESGLAEVLKSLRRLSSDTEQLLASRATPAGWSLADVARDLYDERRRRDTFFPQGLFGEPAWDLLLALYAARAEGRSLRSFEVDGAALVPAAAAVRLVARLKRQGLVVTRASPDDRRRRLVELSDLGFERMSHYLSGAIR